MINKSACFLKLAVVQSTKMTIIAAATTIIKTVIITTTMMAISRQRR